MKLDSKSINEFKQLYFQEYKIQLTDTQAMDYGKRLINMVKAVYGNELPSISVDRKEEKDIV